MRFCIQANTHGIARRSATALPPRDAGREPMLSSPMTPIGVHSWKTASKAGSSCTSARYTARDRSARRAISSSQAGSGSVPGSTVAWMTAETVSSSERSASRRSENLAVMTSPCSVILIRPPTVPGGCARMKRSAGPPPRECEPPRPWKNRRSTRRLDGEIRELRLRGGDHPLAGEQPDVLAGIRVAEHHVLAPAAQLELTRVGLVAVQPGHRLGGLLERAATLEQREDVEARAGVAGPAVAGRGPEQPRAPGQPQRAQHVGRALGVREDERVDRPRPERGVPARDRVERGRGARLGAAVAGRKLLGEARLRQQLDALLG